MKSLALTHEDAQDKKDWRVRIRGRMTNHGFPETGCQNGLCVRGGVTNMMLITILRVHLVK